MTNSLQSTQVGKFYKVPCVQALTKLTYADQGTWIPVLLPMHDDAEVIKFPERHYHLDVRFISERIYTRFDSDRRAFFAEVVTELSRTTWRQPRIPLTSSLEFRYKKCLRSLPDWYPHGSAPWMKNLEAKYKHSVMKNRICPHKGMDLSDCPVADGKITCPAHGLTWNSETGALIPHCK